jgi:hypothetical protein
MAVSEIFGIKLFRKFVAAVEMRPTRDRISWDGTSRKKK